MASEESHSPVMELRSEVFNRFIELKLRSTVHEDTGYAELRSEVFNRFIELKLRSTVHEDTGYVSSVLTPGYIDSWIVGWIGLIKCLY